MGSIEHRLGRLEERAGVTIWELECPECGQTWTINGDAPVLVLAADHTQWAGRYPDGPPRTTEELIEAGCPPEIAALFEHEHDVADFIDQRTGYPFLSKRAGGVLGMDLSAGG